MALQRESVIGSESCGGWNVLRRPRLSHVPVLRTHASKRSHDSNGRSWLYDILLFLVLTGRIPWI